MSSYAALLFLEHPSDTLAWWVAHHLAVGFSSLLIFDALDDSQKSEEMRSFLWNAAGIYDIRLISTQEITSKEFSTPAEKQEKAFSYLVRTTQDAFSWYLPLSIDEYFWTTEKNVKEFFSKIEQKIGTEELDKTSSLPVNWCLITSEYPSSCTSITENTHLDLGIKEKNFLNTVFTLTSPLKIAPQNFADHRVTRSFFRPHPSYKIPSPLEHLTKEADWSLCRILHEASLNETGIAKTYYQQTTDPFPEGSKFLIKTQNIAAELLNSQFYAYILHHLSHQNISHKQGGKPQEDHEETDIQLENIALERAYITHLDSLLVFDHQTERLTWRPRHFLNHKKETALCIAYHLFSDSSEPISPAWIFPSAPLPRPFLSLKDSSQRHLEDLLPLIPLHLREENSKKRIFSLHCPYTQEKISLLGQNIYEFQQVPEDTPFSTAFLSLAHLLKGGMSIKGILNSLSEMPFICPGSFASVLINAIKEGNYPSQIFFGRGFSALADWEGRDPLSEQISFTQSHLLESPFVFRNH